ncbi:hypothetical protein DN745_17645 [Bradymonas sediminis]|uniref:Intracellular proteinase inhibitor BsuPI domain-containing protein n=2 Tax=Bradymonas sediminis TaxID=1548548 RepID=A0A2Z4FQI2_9DELT|nr:hypothetical protein DN745_17645 [Bradymonas sediminis]
MQNVTKALVIGLIAVTLTACSNDRSQNTGGWDIGTQTDTGADASADTGTDAGTMSYQINFELKNESGAQLYAYKSVDNQGPCSFEQQFWLSIERNGEAVRPGQDCGVCSCEAMATGTCALCDVACAAPSASSTLFEDGDSRQYQWDGRVWYQDPQDHCITPELAAGETLKATFCYGAEFFEDEASHISNPSCQTIEFTLDQPEQTVRVVIPPPA